MIKANVFVLGLVAALALPWSTGPVWAQSTCPSSVPTCDTNGNPADLSGTFICTVVSVNPTGRVSSGVVTVTSNGAGSITGSQANNNNGSSSTTYSDFAALPGSTYCLNTNDTGYVFPSGGGCAMALVIDNGKTEVRLIDTTENNASALVCNKQ
ncbi:MAG TPA: hypothetical protein VKV28_07540 [Candidatus Binataceae bacterium]|nr:hypothetical protein [Candidatus Binataceae bacterium]